MTARNLRIALITAIADGVIIRINGSLPIIDARTSVSGDFLVLYDEQWHSHGVWPASPLWQALEAIAA